MTCDDCVDSSFDTGQRDRTDVAQDLLDGGVPPQNALAQLIQIIWIGEQQLEPCAQHRGGRRVPREDEEQAIGDQVRPLLTGAVFFGEHRNKVVARFAGTPGQEFVEVGEHVSSSCIRGVDGCAASLSGEAPAQDRHRRTQPFVLVAIDAEHVSDDPERQRRSEQLD